MSELDEARSVIFKIAQLNKQLKKLGIVRQEYKIPDDYAKWFCLHKYSLESRKKENHGCFAVSKFGEKIQIRSRIGSDINFPQNFDNIDLNKIDYLIIVFMNKETWMIDSIYKVSHKTLKDFFDFKQLSFNWNRESRSLSLQLYPEEDNMISL